MRLPLKARVVLFVAGFNLAFFSAGLAWSVDRLRQERTEVARGEQGYLRESLRNLLLDLREERVAQRVLLWPNWKRYDDALLVQLKEFEERFGLIPAVRSVADSGRPLFIPSGMAVPLRRRPALKTKGPGKVWAVLLLPARPRTPLAWALAAATAPLLTEGEADAPLERFTQDGPLGAYLQSELREAWDANELRRVRGGVVVPARDPGGRVFGAVYAPWLAWALLPLDPARWTDSAVFVGRSELGFGPTLDASGLYLNPLGSAHRPATFDEEAVLSDIRRAVIAEDTQETERGLSVPLRLASGEMWGGLWVRPRAEELVRPLLRELLPAFLLSTLLLTGATFFGMQTLVLEPVRNLARGARRLAGGDLSARIPEKRGRDEVSDLVRSFNAMAGQVEGFNTHLGLEVERATQAAREAEAAAMRQRRLAATGELAAGIAHEINNPLGGLLNALEVLRREDLAPDKRKLYLDLVEGGLERIRETVGQLLRLAPRASTLTSVTLADPIGDALGLVRHRAAKQGTPLRLEGVGGEREAGNPGAVDAWRALPRVQGLANDLGQAVLNLLVNALDATEGRSGAGVWLGLEAREGQDGGPRELCLWVRDEGPGMDPALLARAADLFFTTKDIGRGTGLGLAIVHNVVTSHGGRIRWSNVEAGGFRVDLCLPAEDGAA